MELPFPYFLGAIALASFFHLTANSVRYSKFWHSMVFGILVISAASIFSKYSTSKYLQANEPMNLGLVERSCQLLPDNWRTCLRAAEMKTKTGRHLAAEQTLRQILRFWPNHFVALRLLSANQWQQNKKSTACQYADQYAVFFPETNWWVSRHCSKAAQEKFSGTL